MKELIAFLDEYKFHIIVVLSILFFLVLFIFRDKIARWMRETPTVLVPTDFSDNKKSKSNKKKCNKKTEKKCRAIFEKLLNTQFPSVRPYWLKNTTGKSMELDGYSEKLKLAFEYSGAQHYKFTPYYHKDLQDFEKQKLRDELKAKICKDKGINLIIIPYTITEKELELYIYIELKNYGYIN